jgi:predicted enzyme related to lactoylglutathione lyase
MENAIRWFEIYVSDMKRARAFYEKVFGFHLKKMETSPEMEMWTFSTQATEDGFGALVWMKGCNMASFL